MRTSRITIISLAAAAGLAAPVHAQPTASVAPKYGSPYTEIKSWYVRSATADPGSDPATERLRKVVRARYGQRGLDCIFNNFTGKGAIDPAIPGVQKNILLVASSNKNVSQGAVRTQLYANHIHNDPRFRLLAINETARTPLGNTDKDIRFLDRRTGTTLRIESKEVGLKCQASDARRLRAQIDKIAWEYRRSGELGAIINRNKLLPGIRLYAATRDVPVYECVVTGKTTLRKGRIHVSDVLDDLARSARVRGRVRMLAGGPSAGLGALLLVQNAPAAYKSLVLSLDATTRTNQTVVNLGKSGSLALSGAAMTAAGISDLSTATTTNATVRGLLTKVSRRGGAIAVVGFLGAEGFMVYEYAFGEVTKREFVTSQAGLLSGVGGSVAGAWLGAKAGGLSGSVLGPVGTVIGAGIGGIAGGLGGGYLASTQATLAAGRYYDFKDAELDRRFASYVYALYEVPLDSRDD